MAFLYQHPVDSAFYDIARDVLAIRNRMDLGYSDRDVQSGQGPISALDLFKVKTWESLTEGEQDMRRKLAAVAAGQLREKGLVGAFIRAVNPPDSGDDAIKHAVRARIIKNYAAAVDGFEKGSAAKAAPAPKV